MPESSGSVSFLPAERASRGELAWQVEKIEQNATALGALLEATSDVLMVLNRHRQIVYTNGRLAEIIGPFRSEDVLGARPGEAFSCAHAWLSLGGCGTSDFCRTCGAAQALLAASRRTADERECRIQQKEDHALDLRVRAVPIEVEGEPFTVFSATDIRHEKRRRALERIFFHDVLNVTSGLRWVADALNEGADDPQEMYGMLTRLTNMLLEDINSQQELVAAESGELVVRDEEVDAVALVQELGRDLGLIAEEARCRIAVAVPE